MPDLLIFNVRIILNNYNYEIFAPLHDLNINVGDFMALLIIKLKEEEDEDMVDQLQKSINSSKIYCSKKLCSLNSKFIDLFSKVEKIDGREVDVFEFKLL
jgi:hypothetical protein